MTDTTFTTGEAGVWSYESSSAGSHRFDNFAVTVPSAALRTWLGGGLAGEHGLARRAVERPMAAVTPPAGQTWRVYYYAGGQPIAMREMPAGDATGTLYYLHQDHLGSVSAVTNADGTAVVGRQYYRPYGGPRGTAVSLPTDRAFTGQVRDATGLDYFRARYFSSSLGRFISADSIVPGTGNPQNLNRYAYVRNSPINLIDPSGHDPCTGNPHTYQPDCGVDEDEGSWLTKVTQPVIQQQPFDSGCGPNSKGVCVGPEYGLCLEGVGCSNYSSPWEPKFELGGTFQAIGIAADLYQEFFGNEMHPALGFLTAAAEQESLDAQRLDLSSARKRARSTLVGLQDIVLSASATSIGQHVGWTSVGVTLCIAPGAAPFTLGGAYVVGFTGGYLTVVWLGNQGYAWLNDNYLFPLINQFVP